MEQNECVFQIELLEQNKFCDMHLHLADCKNLNLSLLNNKNYFCLSSNHSKNDLLTLDKIKSECSSTINLSFGIHPQNPNIQLVEVLENSILQKKINAIGEAGFDFFTPELKLTEKLQTQVFEAQLELCQKYNLPLIIHARKSMQKIFYYSKELSKINAVIFHSFSGTMLDADSILRHNVNAYFSFGKPLLNGAKKAIECVKLLPINRIVFETDSPYQTLKGQPFSIPEEIISVYKKAYEIKYQYQNQNKNVQKSSQELQNDFCIFTNSIFSNCQMTGIF